MQYSTSSHVNSGKTNARRPCGGRKRSTSKKTVDYLCLTVKKFHDMPLRTIRQQHLPDIWLPVIYKRLQCVGFVRESPIEKRYLNARHRHLRLRFAKDFLERMVSLWWHFAYTSLFNNPVTRESQRVICGPRFPKLFRIKHLKFKHSTQLVVWCCIKAWHPVVWR